MWKRIAAVGGSAAALVATGLVAAAPASASSTTYAYNPKGQIGGYGQFVSNGEWWYACDSLADGYGVDVDWYVVSNPSNGGSVWDRSGADGVCASFNASISEGKAVNYRICFTANGYYVSCTDWIRDYA